MEKLKLIADCLETCFYFYLLIKLIKSERRNFKLEFEGTGKLSKKDIKKIVSLKEGEIIIETDLETPLKDYYKTRIQEYNEELKGKIEVVVFIKYIRSSSFVINGVEDFEYLIEKNGIKFFEEHSCLVGYKKI